MTTSSEHVNSSAAPEVAGLTLQTDEAKATAEQIVADNAALEDSYQAAEARAEATAEQAHQLAEATEEVLEELQEIQERADPA